MCSVENKVKLSGECVKRVLVELLYYYNSYLLN